MKVASLKLKVFSFLLLLLGVSIFGAQSASAMQLRHSYTDPITIYNATSTLRDYQVKVTFQPDEFDFTKSSSTGADIYFTLEDDSVISHYIQTFSNTATTTIWVKVPVLDEYTTTTIYMNYGYLEMSESQSSGADTFLFFDNFDNNSIGDWATSSLLLDPADGESVSFTTSSAKSVSPPSCAKLYGYASCDASPWDGVIAIMTKTLSLPALDSYAIDFNMWQEIVRFRWSGTQTMTSTIETNSVKIWDSGVSCTGDDCSYNSGWQEVSVVSTNTIETLAFTNHAYDCQEDNLWVDDVRIRNYSSVEPVVTFTPVERTCDTIANAATYNSYPTCGVATCSSGFTLANGSCVANVSSGGSVTIVLPSGIGSGARDSGVIGASTIGATVNAGTIDQSGTNVLTYITNTNNFTAPESSNGWNLGSHNFVITDLDLYNYIVTITFNSLPVTVRLKKGDSINIDLDGDRIADVCATFTDTFVNRAEITVKSLARIAGEASTPIVSSPVTATKYIFKKNLSFGMTSSDVKELQKFLNANGFVVAKTGAGSPGQEITRFGGATRTALIKFQQANKIKPASGLFGPVTRGVANK